MPSSSPWTRLHTLPAAHVPVGSRRLQRLGVVAGCDLTVDGGTDRRVPVVPLRGAHPSMVTSYTWRRKHRSEATSATCWVTASWSRKSCRLNAR
jgi:hypothetical protein